MPATRSSRSAPRGRSTSISSGSSLSSATSRTPSPVAPFRGTLSNRPGSPSYVEMARRSPSPLRRQHSTVDLEEKLTSSTLRKETPSEKDSGINSNPEIIEDVIMKYSSDEGQAVWDK
ncbi:hypothetical protein RMATCC62417_17780 [Rhizopus microsporus]|nr:hypothetical protein RMATCC62417_17780 [Rhizopus microsporus]